MAYGNLRDLVSRIKYNVKHGDESRPIALLVGSGLTSPAVPGVTQIVMSIRKAIDEEDRSEFDSEISKQDDSGHKYQAAFSFLSRRMPPVMSDRVITASTLNAYKGMRGRDTRPTLSELAAAERDFDNWILPAGVEALGRIWAGLPTGLRGPVITTNFDPLVEIAIAKAGASAFPRAMDADGTFIHDITLSEIPQVVHLHGFWRESQTLHMATQLTSPRPALGGSLRALLSRYTVVVLGYSGWQDAVMLHLAAIVEEQSARDLDVLWCHYGDDESLDIEFMRNPSLSNLRRAMGNVQFYTSVDVNSALPALEEALAPHLRYGRGSRRHEGGGSLLGWTPVSPNSLKNQNETSARARALDYFEGRVPALRDGFNKFIPARDVVSTVVNELKSNVAKKTSSLTLLTGASGEGKSTALIQAAARASMSQDLGAVWIKMQGKILSVEAILSVPTSGQPLLLFIDEGHESVSALNELVVKINAEGWQDIHIVLASRDTDWAAVGGQTFAWQNYLLYRKHFIRGMSRPDASAIVGSWEKLGPEALGSLVEHPLREEKISALLTVAQDQGLNRDGSLFGAMLAIRYGSGLVEHVRNLLVRLRDRIYYSPGTGRDMSLAEAFMYIAVPHDLGISSLDHSVLANLLGVSKSELEMNVLAPLGEESPIAIEGRYILTRHNSIAHAAVEVAEELNFDIKGICEHLVSVAVQEIEARGLDERLRTVAYMSQNIDNAELKLVAAKAAVRAAPNRLSYRTSLSSAYRYANQPESGSEVGEQSVQLFATALDRQTGIRISLTEWGVCEGRLGDYRTNAFLAGLALADLSPDLDVNPFKISGSITCLGVAFDRLWRDERSVNYALGLGGVAYIGTLLDLDEDRRRQIGEWKRVSEEGLTVGSIDSLDSALQALQRGVQQVRPFAKPEASRSLANFSLTFGKLQRALQNAGTDRRVLRS